MERCRTCGLGVRDAAAEQHHRDCLVWRGAIYAGAPMEVVGQLFWKAVGSAEKPSDEDLEWD